MLLNLKILAAFEVLHKTKGEADRYGEWSRGPIITLAVLFY